MRSQLLFRLNSILGQPLVSRLEFRIDDKAFLQAPGAPAGKENSDELKNEVSLELWSAANAISDNQLRKTFLSAAATSLQRKERQP